MKVRAFLKVAKTNSSKGYRVQATTRPTLGPLGDVHADPLPTISFAIDLVIPDSAFRHAEQVIAEVAIPEDAFKVEAIVTPVAEAGA